MEAWYGPIGRFFTTKPGYSPMLTPPRYYIYHKAAIYNLTTLCLNGTLPCVDFMDVIMGDMYRYSPMLTAPILYLV